MDRNGFEGISWGYTILHHIRLGKIIKHVQMLSDLVHMLKWSNYSSIPSGTSWRECYLAQSAPNPFLFRTKFEQLYIAKCVLLI